MSEAKSAGATWRAGSQRLATVLRCEDWVLDRAFTLDLVTTTDEYYAEITWPTRANRSSNGIFE